jgi:CRP-like cAMP-binding protein
MLKIGLAESIDRDQTWDRSINSKKHAVFEVESFLRSLGIVTKVAEFRQNEVIFSQGDPVTDVLYYIQKGSVKRSVVSQSGKERVVSILGAGDFLGTWCLYGHPTRPATTSAILPTSVLVIGKSSMVRALHSHNDLSDRFIGYLLARWIRIEEDLIDQLFNSSERRLARVLMLLAQSGEQKDSGTILPKVSQQMLAEMIGASRQQVNALMNKFRKQGFIDYDGTITIHRSLAEVTRSDPETGFGSLRGTAWPKAR